VSAVLDVDPLDGAATRAELADTAAWIAARQRPSGMIAWFDGGHCDPWNHVETAMALDVMGRHDAATRAYRWLADVQRADGAWHNYYAWDGAVEDAKLDSNVCAYLGTGLWHHHLCTGDDAFARGMWPTLERAVAWVLGMRRPDGTVLWAREADATPWDYALLTGSCSIRHALDSAASLGDALGTPRPAWRAAAAAIDAVVAGGGDAFEPKDRWAMDWYYPVLTGAVRGDAAKARLAERWDAFVLDGLGVRCVADERWVTASETAECAIAHAAIGDVDTARALLRTTRRHRDADGGYLTGIAYPQRVAFPADERTAYTAAAVILAADAIGGLSPASRVFRYDAR
jgi:hypothetical protein